MAKPIPDYAASFEQNAPKDIRVVFACNGILNYQYAQLEGKKPGSLCGPFTFGEIAYQLVNQTLVYVTLETRMSPKWRLSESGILMGLGIGVCLDNE